MERNTPDPEPSERAVLLYGLQRTGSNYTRQLLLQNFQHLCFCNQGYSRCLPTHKHFRLYDEKSAIPDVRFYNNFRYSSFQDFREHAGEIAGRGINIFIIVVKDPYSWYLSYKRHARKNKYPYFKGSLNAHYLIDYNLFYRKWLDFSMEAPEEVILLRYEDLIEDLDASLGRICEKFSLQRSSGALENPSKVNMNREFTRARSAYYKEKKYLELISERDRHVMQHLLDPELISGLNYQIIR